MSKKKEVRSRLYVGMRNYHFETHNEKNELIRDISKDDWKKEIINDLESLVNTFPKIKEFWAIFHDKDITDDEFRKLKPLHVHFVIEFENPVTYQSLYEKMKISSTHNLENVRTSASVYRYLLHLTDEAFKSRKYIYKPDDLYCVVYQSNNKIDNEKGKLNKKKTREYYSFKICGKERQNKNSEQSFIDELLDKLGTEIKYVELDFYNDLLKEFGNGKGIRLYNKWKNAAKDAEKFKFEKLVNEYQSNNIDRETVSLKISGSGGSGKSTLATSIIQEIKKRTGMEEYRVSVGNSSIDYLSDYRGEEIAFFDDLEAKKIEFNTFVGMFDRHLIGRIQSRYQNKVFMSKFNIVTSSDSLENLCEDVARIFKGAKNYEDKQYQVLRRFSYEIVYNYSDITNKFLIRVRQIPENKMTKVIQEKVYKFDSLEFVATNKEKSKKYIEFVDEIVTMMLEKS